jgi:glycosyltransferase involved in cell wall biosynthesis
MVRKLYVDLSVLGPGMTGVLVYAMQLAREMTARFDCTVVVPSYWSHAFPESRSAPGPFSLKGSLICRRPLWKRSAGVDYGKDAFVYAPHMRGFLDAPRQAITVHDLIAHFYPTRNAVDNAYNTYILPKIVRKSKLVLTVSESSRIAISDFYDVPKQRIAVVPNGIDLYRWKPASNGTSRPGEEYLLIVSANRVYKNTLEVLQNHALWSGRYKLKIVSSKARYGVALRAAVAELGLEKRVEFLDGVSEDRLIELYQHAVAVVYPSLIEGFGRPALEGMAAGRPVILSDIPPHVELFSESAIFITPGQVESWRRAFATLDDNQDVEGRKARGLEIASRYSWSACGDRLADALLAAEPELGALLRSDRLVASVTG